MDDIEHSVKVDKQTYKSAAAIHNVKPALVQQLMTGIKKDPEYISKRKEKQDEKLQLKVLVAETAFKKLKQRDPILSSQSIANEINQLKGTTLKSYNVAKIMRNEMGWKYKKFKTDSIQANSERCLVERQQYAVHMFRLIQEGKVIYNIDESWIDQMNFTRQHWRPVHFATEGMKQVSPRISLIACVGSDGSSYYSLTQVNTNENVFCTYLTWLVRRLHSQDRDWRDKCVFLLE